MNNSRSEAQKLWNKKPCGTRDISAALEPGTKEFFSEVRRKRYEEEDLWIKELIDSMDVKGKNLLEIGFGMGTDLLEFCTRGAQVYGIDITPRHYELAKRNFEINNKITTLKLCDAASIDFPSDYFDIVYSLGVLHHASDTVRCISEAYRVLRPGGKFIMAVYYKYSAFHIFSKLIHDGILKGRLKKLGYDGLMSTVESGADGINIKPLVKTYSKGELRIILSDFQRVEFKISLFKRGHMPGVGKIIPVALEKYFEKYLGWYLTAYAIK